MSLCAVDRKLILHVPINSVAVCQSVHILQGVRQNRQTHSTDTTYSSHDRVTSHSHHHRSVRWWWLCDITWVIMRRLFIGNRDERNWDVTLTFVLIRTTALNYTSEMFLNGDISRLREVTCSEDEPLQGRSDFHFSSFLSSFISPYCSCLFLVPLFFRCPFLHFSFSYHLPIHSFINPHIRLSVHLSIRPLTGVSNFHSFFISSSLFLYFFRFLCRLILFWYLRIVRPLCSFLCFSLPVTPYLFLFSTSISPLIRHVKTPIKHIDTGSLKTKTLYIQE
jgi:hypothetical protein